MHRTSDLLRYARLLLELLVVLQAVVEMYLGSQDGSGDNISTDDRAGAETVNPPNG